MAQRMMLLPATTIEDSVIVTIPNDYGGEEAFRRVTGLIAQVEEENPGAYDREDILEILEDHGFMRVEFEMGPELDL